MRNQPFAKRKCRTANPTKPLGAMMIKFTKRRAKSTATLAVVLSCATGFALASGTGGDQHVQTSAHEDVASAKWHLVVPIEDMNAADAREMLEEKLILHGHLPLRARAREYVCGSRSDYRLTKQDQTMNTLSASVVEPATSFVRNNIDAQFVTSEGL